jgi:hypothetical protein
MEQTTLPLSQRSQLQEMTMGDKRQTRKDLPEREFDSDLNSPALSNYDDPPVDQRDSDERRAPEKA